jgi:hypothetical protein
MLETECIPQRKQALEFVKETKTRHGRQQWYHRYQRQQRGQHHRTLHPQAHIQTHTRAHNTAYTIAHGNMHMCLWSVGLSATCFSLSLSLSPSLRSRGLYLFFKVGRQFRVAPLLVVAVANVERRFGVDFVARRHEGRLEESALQQTWRTTANEEEEEEEEE